MVSLLLSDDEERLRELGQVIGEKVFTLAEPLPLHKIRAIAAKLPQEDCSLHRACVSLVFSKPEQPDIPSKELTERRKYLQRRFEEREYARMVGDCGDGSMQVRGSAAVKAQSGRGASVGEDMHALRGAMSTAVNMVAAVAASFAVGYYAGKGTDGTQRTGFLFGLAGAIIVLVVEMALFIIRALREERLAANKDK